MNSKIYLALCLATQVLGAAIHGADAVGLMKVSWSISFFMIDNPSHF